MSDANFEALVEKLMKLPARPPGGGTAVAWSGFDKDGVHNSANAEACVQKYGANNYYTIAQTPAGEFLNGPVQTAFNKGAITEAEKATLEKIASSNFARQASGGVVAFVQGASVDRVFAQIELDEFLANPNVSSINNISKAQIQGDLATLGLVVVLGMLGDDASCFPPSGPPPSAPAVVTDLDQIAASTPSGAPQPTGHISWPGIALATVGVVLTFAAALTGVAEAAGVAVGVAALAARVGVLLGLATATAASADPVEQAALPVQKQSNEGAIGLGVVDLEIGVASGNVDASILKQFSSDQLALSNLKSALGSSSGPVSGAIDDGAGGTIKISLTPTADGQINLQLSGPSGTLTANLANIGTASAAITFKSNDGKEEGAFLVDTSSSQQDSAFIRKGQDGSITFGFVDGRQIVLSADGSYSVQLASGASISLIDRNGIPAALSSNDQNQVVTFLNDFTTSLSQHYQTSIPSGIADLLNLSNGTYTLAGPNGNDVIFGPSGVNLSPVLPSAASNGNNKLLFGGSSDKVTNNLANTELVTLGNSDNASDSQSGQAIVGVGSGGDVLNGQTSNTSGLDKLAVVGTASGGGADTLNAGIGNNIMIGDGVNTTFNIDTTKNPSPIDVVWGAGGSDTINVTGAATVYVVDAPDATLASVKNLDFQALYQKLISDVAIATYVFGARGPIAPTQGPAIIAIDPTPNEKLVVDGQQITSGPGDPTVAQADLSSITGMIENVAGPVVGLAQGDFGITLTYPTGTKPQVNLANYQVQASPNAGGGPGGGGDPSVVDQSTISGFDFSDTLLSISAATITQFSASDTLIAANGADTLEDLGSNDTLIGNVAGSTLFGNRGNPQFDEVGTTVAYTANGVTVDLSAGTASAAGTTASDTLMGGIQIAEALGANDVLIGNARTSTLSAEGGDDTLIGGSGTTTLLGSVNGSTLMAGSGTAVVDYRNVDANVVVNLTTQTVTSSGSSASDTLVGIRVAEISDVFTGTSDTLIGDSGNDTLIAGGWFGTVIAGSGDDTLIGIGDEYNTLIGGSGNDLLTTSGGFDTLMAGSGSDTLVSTSSENVLIGGSGNDLLSSVGFSSLIAGTGIDTLTSTGYDDTLVGNGLGSTLSAETGELAVAYYTVDNVVIDLTAGTATVNGSSTSDTLINIGIVQTSGNDDTLLGGPGTTTLTTSGSSDALFGGSGTTEISVHGVDDTATGGSGTTTISNSGSAATLVGGSGTTTLQTGVAGNTVIAGTGSTIAVYNDDGDVVDLATETASLAGSPSDTLVGISSAAVVGQDSTLIGGGAGDVLSAEGSNNTLIAGSGVETLTSSLLFGTTTSNTLIAGSAADTLSSSGSEDLLIAGDGASEILSSSGKGNSLVAGSGIDTLTSTGTNDTLFGNGSGSTLDGTSGSGVIAAYNANNVNVNLATGTAGINGSGVFDTLLGINAAAALGTNDTLIDGDGGSTLISDAGGNALMGGTGETVAAYTLNDLTVNLVAGTAGVNGSGVSDTLIGIHAASITGSSDTVIGDGGTDVLSATGSDNTLEGGAGNDSLTASGAKNVLIAGGGTDVLTSSSGSGNTLLAGAGSDILTSNGGTGDALIAGSGSDTLSSTGTSDTLLAGSGTDVLNSTGTHNSLFAGTGVSTLSSSGSGDTLFGSGDGSTLNATGFGATVVYSLDNVTVNLATGAAGVNGSGVTDTLSGFQTAAVLGSNDTLIDGNNGSTLISNAGGNTLVGGTGETVAEYANNNLAVNLAAGTASVNGSGTSDTLIGIHAVAVSGSNDTVTGDSGTDLLSSSGSGNTLIAGSGIDTLTSTGTDDTLFGNLMGSTLEETEVYTGQAWQQGTGAIAAYTADNATINLLTRTAQANGSSVSDQLVGGIKAAEALGNNDTLVGIGGTSTLISDVGDNTLMVGTGDDDLTAVLYEADDVTVNLVAQTVTKSGATASDTLVGIMVADVTGNNDTLIGSGTGDTLTAENASDVIAYAVNNLSVNLVALAIGADDNGNIVVAGTAGVNGTNAEDRLVNVSNVLVSGTGDSVTGGMTSDSMTATGSDDILIAGIGSDVMIASGNNDTLVGGVAGGTLEATSSATATVALYTYDDVTIDLSSGSASSLITTASDTLIGISAVTVTGAYDTLLGGNGSDTLTSSGLFNSLVGGSGAELLESSGQSDILIAGSGTQTLLSQGAGITLIAGSAADLLTSSGSGDTLVGNALGSTLNGTGGTGAIAAYTMDNVTVDLAAGTASVNGSSVADTLIGMSGAAVSGTRDTVIAGSGASVLISSGLSDTLFGGSGTDTLSSTGSSNTLIGGSGIDLLTSSGSQDSLVAGSGADVLASSGFGDVLQGGSGADSLSSSGTGNTLIAGSGVDVLSSTGIGDTLFGNGTGSTLIGTNGVGTVAAYAINNLTIDLVTDTATVNGSSLSDSLQGISSVLLTGSGDTLIGGTGATTLYSDGAGNTLVAGAGQTTVVYTQDNVTVDLATASATVSGSNTSDTLVEITNAIVSGAGDTLIGGNGSDVLSSNGSGNTLIGGSGRDTLSSSGFGDTLLAGAGADVLSSSGQGNELVAGSAADSLISTGFSDILVGNAAGSTLDGSAGFGAIAAYTVDNVTVNLATGAASVNGSGVSDTLLGITTAMALGANDTLIGGSGATTLFSNAGGNTLVAGAGQTAAAFALDDVTVNLATASAIVAGSSVSDKLVNITDGLVSGSGDILIGGGNGDILSSNGQGNTLVAGSGAETLASSGFGDTLFGNAASSTLDGTNGSGTIAAYTQNDVTVDLTSGTATVNGSGVSDTVLGISSALAGGTGDTLIGGAGATTLFSDAAGNTLVAGAGQTTAAYTQDNVTINLAAGSATVNGSNTSDILVGVTSADVSGAGDTLIGNSAGNILEADGTNDVVLGGSGVESLISTGSSNTLVAGSGNNSLSSSGVGDSLVGGAGADTLSSSGFGNSLLAGTGVESLVSTGEEDTLFGNAASSTLNGSGGFGAVAAYTQNDVTVNLADGTAGINGSSVADTLVGIDSATISGIGDTLIGDSGTDTLTATGSNDLVEAGSGAATLVMNSGTNTFVAGAGVDTFVVQSAAVDGGLNQPQNLIGNFNPANDTIDLTQIAGVSSFTDLSFSTVTFDSQSYLDVTLGSTGQAIMLSGLSASDLSASNFLFQQAAASVSAPTVTITSAAEASNVAAQTITGTVVPGGTATVVGQTVTLTDNGAAFGTATVQSDGTFSANVTLPNQGANSIVATVTDSFGNIGTSAAVVDTLDNVAPTVTIASAAEASNVAAQTITGTVTAGGTATVAGQTVTLTDNGTTLGTATVQSDGSFLAALTLPNQGTNSIVATVTDSYGNTGTSAAVVDTLDNIAPMVMLTSASEASNVASQTITGTVVSGGTADVVGQTVTLMDNGTALGTATVQSDGSFSANLTLPNQGNNSIVATVTDSFGNTGSSTAVIDALDNVAPTVTITSAAEVSKNPNQTITGTVVSGGVAAVVGQIVTLTDNGTTLSTATVQSDGTFSANVTLPNQGSNAIAATVTDSFGNTGTSTAVVDTVTPTVAVSLDKEDINLANPTGLATFTFSEAPTSFSLADTSVVGGTLSDLQGSGTSYTAIFTAAAGIDISNASVSVVEGRWQDAGGNPGAGGSTAPFTVDTLAPTASSIVASPNSGDENTGNTVMLTLTLSKSVTVIGTPALSLNDGGSAVYQSGAGTNVLTFAYTVANGQNTANFAVTGNNLNGSSIAITDADGNEADLSGADATFAGLAVGAAVRSVVSSPASGDLGPGKVVTFAVTMTEAVKVAGGTPTLFLNDGGTATYKSGSGSNVLNFSYTVGALGSGQNAAALAVTGVNLNGATVYDSNVTADTADLSGVAAFTTGPQVDTLAPMVSSVLANPANGDLGIGATVTLTVTFSETVIVSGSPYLALNDGAHATFVGGSGSNALTFTYTVAAGQNTADLTVTGLSTNGGTIRDGAGNNAVLSGAVTNPLGVLQIDTKPPAVTERLISDTGVSNTDKITNKDGLTGGGDPNAVVQFTIDGVASNVAATASSTGVWTFTPTGLADGTHTIVASETDAAGNTGTASLTFMLDTTAPAATAIATNPANTDLDAGNTVTVTVDFDSAVYAAATSYLTLNDGGRATYAGGSGSTELTFTYTVAAGQNTSRLAVTGFSSGLADIAGNAAILNGIPTNPGGVVQIDTVAPKITSITTSGTGITAGAGDRGPGSVVNFTVNFSENVVVNTAGGTPTLALNDGGAATYVSGSGSTALTFAYTVGALGGGENTADLALAATGALNLNGGAITDNAGNTAVLTAANGYNPAGILQIDTTAPTVTTVVVSPATGEVTTGHLVKITLDTSEAVTVTGTPQLLLNDGGIASYDAAHSTSKALVFDYTVAAGDMTTDLMVSGIQLASSSAIADLAGNAANLAGAGANLGLRINTTGTGPAGPSGGNLSITGNSELELFGASVANVTLASGSTGTLKLDASSQFTGTVAGLVLGNYLDLADLPYAGNAPLYSASGTNTGTLAVTEGAKTINVAVLGSYSADSFVASNDGHGGTLLEDPPSSVHDSDLSHVIGSTAYSISSSGFSTGSTVAQGISPQGLAIENQLSQLVQAMASHSAESDGFEQGSSSAYVPPNNPNSLAAAWH